MPDVITGSTQLGSTRNDIIVSQVQRELRFAAKLLPFVSDFSSLVGRGMKSIALPKLGSFTVQNRGSAVAGDIQTIAASTDVINLDFKAYNSWLIDANDEAQSAIRAQLEFALRAASAHGRYIDEQLLALIETASGFNAGPGPVTRDIVLNMREEILKNDGDLAKCVYVFGPDQEKELLKINEFTHNDIYGQAVIPSGQIGRLYSIPVLIHNGVSAGEGFLWEASGVGFAQQLAPAMAEQPEIAYGTSAKRVAMDTLWGIAALQKGEKGKGPTQSPLIVKMTA